MASEEFKDLEEMLRRMLRPLSHALYDIFIRRFFRVWEGIGLHITVNDFYQPIPDIRTLKDELWLRESRLAGIDMKEHNQVRLLNDFSSRFKIEYETFPRNKAEKPYHYYVNNGSFVSVDGEILYCMIRHLRPRRVVEIGSGNSTYLSAQSLLKNEEETGQRGELIAIDPNPNKVIRSGFPGFFKLMPVKVENVDLAEFAALQENDILFIDSSHVLKIGNDVQYEYLDILPRLNKGVIVHLHDIFLPREYPRKWVMERHIFWNEQYLLQAFLAFNSAFEVLWAGHYMHLKHPEKLEEAFGSYDRGVGVGPGSFWIRKKV